ncbi:MULTISPECIES: flagellin [Geobacillus]|uniref:Flagellin n=1 Tax=Geobacillus thermodenitrificans TaxID=33940 RepID=A0ABY9QCM0_GEOTD|nr:MULTISPECIES: flagellin [Geobacillus]ARA98467.1 flagellin [Geobacillus thermodenitrificans]MEC5187918.1 flagellin [Geobacillus thermodenitrificans]MED0663151.1 flagellin [Geobacillus thermodenitrificans]MED3718798.1 flagellin [Geobacillus thermodenitrificans]NNU86204.1 flagellin [Geobacillus sp. MR]
MRINHNIQALNAYRNLAANQSSISKNLERLSSGLRINRAADDAAGLAISEKMRSQIRGLQMAERNALDAISLIQTAEGALNEVHSILQRMRELAVQAANGTNQDTDREALDSEFQQLKAAIDQIGKDTQFNTMKILDSDQNNIKIQIQIGPNNGQTLTMSWKKQLTDSLGENKVDISDLSIKEVEDAQKAIGRLDKAIVSVSQSRSKMGAYQNRLEHTINNLTAATENLTSAESRIRDTDMAMEMAEFTKNNILTQAAQAMLAQSNQLPQGILQLLKS